jgi:hypothetical protein
MDRLRLPPGGRALLLPAVLLALAWAGSAPAATAADLTRPAVRAAATPAPHLQSRRTTAVQPAVHHQRRARRALASLAILGAGPVLAMAAAAATRRITRPWRPGIRPPAPRPRAPPLAA